MSVLKVSNLVARFECFSKPPDLLRSRPSHALISTSFKNVLNKELRCFLSRPENQSFERSFPSTCLPRTRSVLGTPLIDGPTFQKLVRSMIRSFRSVLAKTFTSIPAELPAFIPRSISRHINWLISMARSSPKASVPVRKVKSAPVSPRSSSPVLDDEIVVSAPAPLLEKTLCPIRPSGPPAVSLEATPPLSSRFVPAPSGPLVPTAPVSDPVRDARLFADLLHPIKVRVFYETTAHGRSIIPASAIDDLCSHRFFTNIKMTPPRFERCYDSCYVYTSDKADPPPAPKSFPFNGFQKVEGRDHSPSPGVYAWFRKSPDYIVFEPSTTTSPNANYDKLFSVVKLYSNSLFTTFELGMD